MSLKSLNELLPAEDNSGDARPLREMIYEHGAQSTRLMHVARMPDTEEYLGAEEVDLLLLDPGSSRWRVVAQGVETQEELAFLKAQHCDDAQGFYFSRPVAATELARLLETGLVNRVHPRQMRLMGGQSTQGRSQ